MLAVPMTLVVLMIGPLLLEWLEQRLFGSGSDKSR